MTRDAASDTDWDPDLYAARSGVQTAEGLDLIGDIPLSGGERILDVGCGDGRITAELAGRGAWAVGIDLSEEMVAAVRDRGLRSVRGDGARLPFRSASFDVAVSNAAIHWIADHERTIRELARILVPGGGLFVRVGAAANQWRIETEAVRTFERPPYLVHRGPRLRSPWTMAHPATWAATLFEVGLQIEHLDVTNTSATWQNEQDVRDWFESVGHPFIARLPRELRHSYVYDVVSAAWPHVDPHRAFVRLEIVARKAG